MPIKEIQRGIKSGVRKINIDTDLRLASTAAIRAYLNKYKSNFDPRKYLSESIKEMKKIVVSRLIDFGVAEKASKIKPIPLSVMSKKYN